MLIHTCMTSTTSINTVPMTLQASLIRTPMSTVGSSTSTLTRPTCTTSIGIELLRKPNPIALNVIGPWPSERLTIRMQLESTLTCPDCGHQATAQMPTDACQFFYDCEGCGKRLKPKPGDCCVFCSYGTVPCPPIKSGGCCS